MCGIVGLATRGGAPDAELLARMCATIRHRGPDSHGTWVEDGVGLGAQRLAIIDVAHGDQPQFNEDRSVVVVQNGEIYNHVELRAELEARGHRFRTHTDTEVLVHLYEEHGEAFVERLRGMFAIALWDRRHRRLVLARDRLGKKPLLFAHLGDRLWFGSEAKAILEDPDVPRDVDLAAIDAFLHFRYVPEPRSAFAALSKLPPAHVLVWQDGDVRLRRYWSLSYADAPGAPSGPALHEALREQLLEATRLRLRSDVPVGAFLSGGVDSSAVVAAMARQTATVRTFSIGFDVADFDETEHARAVARRYGTEHEEFRLEADAMGVLPQLVWHMGEPFADESAVPTFHLSAMTARHVKVALTGDGGDEGFAGYERYRTHETLQRLSRAPRPAVRAAGAALERLGPEPPSLLRRARSLTRYLQLDVPDRYAAGMGTFRLEAERLALYTPEFLAAVGEPRWASRVVRDPWEASDATTLVERLLDVDVQTYLPGDLLVKADITSMAHGLELRSPLLDHVLLEFAAGLPAHEKLRGSSAKHCLREALRPWLPDDVLDRPKMGFGVPIGAWLRGDAAALPREVLLDDAALARGWFRPERVRALLDEHAAGTADHATLIWNLLQLELWLQAYVDGHVGEPPAVPVP